MFEFCLRWFAWGFDASLKAALIAIIAAAVLKLLRIKDSNICHRVWTGVLSGMLLLPVLSPLMPALRLPLMPSPEWLIAWSDQPVVISPDAAPILSSPAADLASPIEPQAAQPIIAPNNRSFRPTDFPPARFSSAAPIPPPNFANPELLPPETQTAAQSPTLPTVPVPAVRPPFISRRALAAVLVFLTGGIWLAIAAALTLRLALALWIAARLRRSSIAIESTALSRENTIATVRECPVIRVPLTVGLLQPHILLPPDWRNWSSEKLHAVLAHEQMHAQRADCLVALLAELNCCFYWFHPLAWCLKQQLSSLAEQACDDAAILVLGSSVLGSSASTGDRARYARHLLEVAAAVSRHKSRLAPLGVSMARRSNVETRILAILDFTRPLSQRLTWSKALALLTVMVPLIALAAALQPSTGEQSKPTKTPSENAEAINEKEAATKQADVAAPKSPLTITGSILNAQGQPVPDANIHIVPQFAWRESSKKRTPRLVTKTDNAGRFEFTPEDNEAAKPTTDRLLITAPRYGTEFLPLREVLEQGQLTISLADDKPIRGRILTLEGQPVTDAKITVNRIQSLKSGDLKPYIDIVKAGNGSNFSFDDSLYEPPHIDPITTNAEGRFEVAGIGPNRVAELKVVSRTIQHALLTVMTVESEPLKPREGRGFSDLEKNRPPVFGATFDWVAKPARIITGTVVDAKTHQPITGAGISSLSEGHAKTDENGRFELLGCAKAKSYGLLLNGDNTQYIGGSARVADTPGFEPIEVTLELTRGTTVKGRVIDQATQQPIDHARLTYFPLVPNERVVPGIGSTQANAWGAFTETYCNADGEFSIAALPGPGFIGVSAPKHAAYQPAVVDAIAFFKREGIPYGRDPQPKGFPKNSLMVAGSNGGMSSTPAGQYNFVELLNAPDQPELTLAHDIALVAAQNLAGTVLGPSGQPLTGTTVWGLANDYLHDSQTLRTSAFTVARLGPDETRTLIFRHDAQKLATQLKVTAESPRPQRVTLQPWGEISGRLLDSDGTPLVNLELQPGGELQEGEILGRLPGHVATDDQGRFHLTGLVPGLVYSLTAHRVATPPQIRIRLKPGEILDLGDIKEAHEHLSLNASLPPGEDSPTLTRSVSEGRGVGVSPAMSPPLPLGEGRGEGLKDAAVVSVTGIVLLPTNQPATNTHVAVVADPNKPRQGGDLSRNFEILAEGTTDVAGRFQLQLKGVSSTSHKYANLIARQDGSGIAWQNLNLDMPEVTAKLKLEAEEPIRGRLIDLEGQPASNISLRIRSVMKRTTAEWSQEGIGFDSETLPAAWLAPLTTDQDGRFVIHGISSAHGVALNVAGSDRFAPQDILLNTGMAEERNERDGTYRSLVRNAKPGEEIVLPLSPSQLFEGTIRYDDTQEPVPHARITIWASQQKNGGSMTSVEGQTDATGRYRIAPRPGIRFGVKAYPPNGAAYLVRETTDDIRWESGDRIKQVDLTLPAGILIHGKILTAGSKEPVAGASLQFIPQFTSQSSASQPLPKGIVTGWQGIQVSDSKGDFQIAVPNHPGHLLVNHDTGNFILHEIGSAFLNRGQPGGQRNYAHAIQKIDPANLSSHHAPRDEPKSSRLAPRDEPAEVLKSLNLTIELQPGAIASGRIVDPQGQPIASGIVVSRLHIWSHWLTWHGNNGQTGPIVDGRFELKGLQEGVEYPTHFLDPKRRLGATVLLSSHHAPRDREGEAREGEAREGEAPAEPQQTIVL
ncbi:MAG TPA: M56 family metallopeptidase, partial [Pirellulaceae bacterium]